MAARVTQILDRSQHEKLISEAHTSGKPTVVYVSNSSLPGCKVFTPKYEVLAERHPEVQFLQVDYCRETSDLFKFAPNQLPVLVLVKGSWAKTIMSADISELEEGIKAMLEKKEG